MMQRIFHFNFSLVPWYGKGKCSKAKSFALGRNAACGSSAEDLAGRVSTDLYTMPEFRTRIISHVQCFKLDEDRTFHIRSSCIFLVAMSVTDGPRHLIAISCATGRLRPASSIRRACSGGNVLGLYNKQRDALVLVGGCYDSDMEYYHKYL